MLGSTLNTTVKIPPTIYLLIKNMDLQLQLCMELWKRSSLKPVGISEKCSNVWQAFQQF